MWKKSFIQSGKSPKNLLLECRMRLSAERQSLNAKGDSMRINVIGAGLAGCEAASILTSYGIEVNLYEQKPL
ncbi:MAG: FAD-dependent oxidoreductase, partial [Oscillospiraceae bacterium]